MSEEPAGYDRSAPKSRIEMTLNDDLVRRARDLTGDLGETVERLLADFVIGETVEAEKQQRAIDRHIEASNAFVEAHGSLADEFSTL